MPEYDYNQLWTEVYGDIQRCGPGHHHLRRILRRFLQSIEYATVLEVGCGIGHNGALLTKNGLVPHFDGIDISEKAIERARAASPGRFWVCDIQRECIPGQWDLVVCSLVLEHLHNDDGALAQLRKMTGRYLLLASIAGNFERYRPWEESQGHVRNYAPGELERKVEAAGFTLRKTLYWGFPFYSPIARTLQKNQTAGIGRFTWTARLAAFIFKYLYYLNSHRRGDMVFILAEVQR